MPRASVSSRLATLSNDLNSLLRDAATFKNDLQNEIVAFSGPSHLHRALDETHTELLALLNDLHQTIKAMQEARTSFWRFFKARKGETRYRGLVVELARIREMAVIIWQDATAAAESGAERGVGRS
ncbi:uncharacterized protein KY384_007987 [Bacidia gigantensis]|uniref:uncharacterized protein n=1 Tax=Bacidia gigantensis TaxID=2732470 RepID=UPI001D0436D2|nr:uncharacterized protein KY384_007987 [Bacidia gigantensis]KAG8527243.1 hypothetical protein KY384_007987 [Bacidia gigantensis]